MSRHRPLYALLVAFALVVPAVRASAVDRSLGATVPRPAIEGEPWTADEKLRLTHDVDALLENAPTLHAAHVGMLALDTRSGDVLYARHPDDAFVPASTMKLLTGSVALATLGSAYRFHTDAYIAPPNETLYIKAGGDPLLESADIAAMARAAVHSGGFHSPYSTVIDAGAFEFTPYPPGWSWDDFVYDYAPKLTPLPVDENAIQLTVSAGKKVGDPVDVRENRPAPGGWDRLAFERCVPDAVSFTTAPATTGNRNTPATVDVVRVPPSDCLEVIGSVALGGEPEMLGVALREPAAHVRAIIRDIAARQSLASGGPAPLDVPAAAYTSAPVPPGARLVWSQSGEALSDLLADMWWPSDNFVAEMLLRAIGLHASGMPGTTVHGADAERAWLSRIGIDPATLTIADGSGLSSYDRLTPRALVTILQADWNAPYRNSVIDDLPLAGVRGTLDRSFIGTPAERRTFAKTGTLGHARALAGYLSTLHHGALTFAWSVDDWMGTDADLRALRARVLTRLIGD